MTTPTPGSDPNYPQGGAPQGQPGWGAPPPPQGYQPAPSYQGGPAGYGAPANQRPPMVLVAAILGFVNALLLLLAAFAYFAFASIVGFLALFGIVYLALAAVNIWGGVVAITGKNGQILRIAGIASGVVALLAIIIAIAGGAGFDTFSLLVLILGAATVGLLMQPQSAQYFASRGAR